MKLLALLFMLLAGAAGCDNAGSDVVPLSGTYIGYFHRSGKDTARVTLRFEDNTFDGSSNKAAYPSIGSGQFRQSESTVSFTLPPGEIAAQDSSLTLRGEYNYSYHDDGTIRIWKTRPESEDEFILKMYLGDVSTHAAKMGQATVSTGLE